MKYFDFGTPISFGYTAQYLPQKSITRRDWKDSHVLKFLNAFTRAEAEGKALRVPAINKAYHRGGKQIGWVLITSAPYKERLKDMSQIDLLSEGGMCRSIKEFATKYFKGDLEKEVWVIKFRFLSLSEIETCKPLAEPQNPPATNSTEKITKSTLEVFTSSKSDEHGTPDFLAYSAREVLGGEIDLDPMSNSTAQKVIRARQFYTQEENGLTKPWIGKIWLNPAFSLADEAVAKLLSAYEAGTCSEALLLLRAAPETKRHQSLFAYPFCELSKRVKFIAEGNKDQAPFSTLIFYLGKNFSRFKEIFEPLGNIRLGQNQVDELENDRRDLLAKVAQLQLELAKKSEFSGTAREIDPTDWLERDLSEQVGIAESRLRELEIDREVLPEDIYIRQRVEWQARLQTLTGVRQNIAKINTRYSAEYQTILEREHPQIESEEGYTSDFATGKLVESLPETGNLLVKIEQYCNTTGGWIAKCNVRISQRVARGSDFLITAEDLFKDFHRWIPTKTEILPQYSLGSIRTSKGLKNHFKDLKLPSVAYPDSTEVSAPDGSIWQAQKDNGSERAAVKWRCEVLPNGCSRLPRINTKNDRIESVASFY